MAVTIDRTESGTNYDDLAEEILRLQEQTVMDNAAKAAHRERIQELLHFINSQPRTITEFDEALVKKLLESVKVCEFFRNRQPNPAPPKKNEPRSTSAQILYSVHHNELL